MNNINSLNPSAYVITAVPQAAFYQYRYVESFVDSTALNRKQSNGRINANGVYGDYYTAVTVSPLHPSFYTQIEKGISSLVYALLAKNYLTISSCEGHGNSPPFIRLALADKSDSELVASMFADIPYVTCRLNDNSANTEVYLEQGVSKVRPLDPAKFSKQAETDGINKLFLRNHTAYCFLDIIFYEYDPSWKHIMSQIKTKCHKAVYLTRTKQQVVNIIKSDTFPVYYK